MHGLATTQAIQAGSEISGVAATAAPSWRFTVERRGLVSDYLAGDCITEAAYSSLAMNMIASGRLQIRRWPRFYRRQIQSVRTTQLIMVEDGSQLFDTNRTAIAVLDPRGEVIGQVAPSSAT